MADEADQRVPVEWYSPDVRNFVEHVRRLLFNALDELEGEKTIVWDRALTNRVNLFVPYTTLASHGVTKNWTLEPHPKATTPYVVFLLTPTTEALDGLCEYIDKSQDDPKTLYEVLFIPEASYTVWEKLKDRNGGKYWERLESVKSLPMWWLPMDGDCLSLNEPQIPSRLLINGDWTYTHRCAVALNMIMSLIPQKVPMYCKGEWAVNVAKIASKRNATEDEPPSAGGLRVNRIVIIDRWLDPLTPLLTQLTYSGMLDEVYGVNMMGSVKVSEAEFEMTEDGDPFKMKEVRLQGDVYQRLRHVHVNPLGLEFAGILQEIKKDEGVIDKDRASVAEYRVLVKKLPEIQMKKKLVNLHMRLAEMVKEQLNETIVDRVKVEKNFLEKSDGDRLVPFIEDRILEAADVTSVLRLIAIHSLTSGGLKPSVLFSYRRLVMQSYGVDAVNKMIKMQKMGLLREKSSNGKLLCEHSPFLFPHMKKQYELVVEDVVESDRSNPAYAYSGYCSLLTKIVAEGDKLKWTGWQKFGEHGGQDDDKTAVFVVGGATRAELALLKQLPNVSMVLTTALVTGDTFLENFTCI